MTCTDGTSDPAHDLGGGRVVATVASADGAPYVVAMSFDWDGAALAAGQIEPGDSDGGREGEPASQMETR